MAAPYTYKICMLGARTAGKSSIVHRLIARTIDPAYRPTRHPSQLFWRTQWAGRDILIEIEDTPGIAAATSSSGDLTTEALRDMELLLKPLMWFEKRRKETVCAETHPRAY